MHRPTLPPSHLLSLHFIIINVCAPCSLTHAIFSTLVVDKSIDLVIPAHDTEVGAIAVNPDGTLIASASERGHIIKIYSTDAGEVVQELKRGNSKAEIDNILFHPHQYILACTSSKQSIHIFEITKAVEKCIQTR